MSDSLLNLPEPVASGPKGPKKEMSSLDIRFMAAELSHEIAGGVFRKIYQYGQKSREMLFEIWLPGRGSVWLYCDRNMIFITDRKKDAPQEPPNFCMFLRKHLTGKKIMTVRQYRFDRVLEIQTNGNLLIFELFSTGNVILCDGLNNIIMPLEIQKWSDREVRPRMPYRHPKSDMEPFSSGRALFSAAMRGSEKKAAAFLAVNSGLGPLYANEVCAIAGVDPERPCSGLSEHDIAAVFSAIERLSAGHLKPVVYADAVSPFPLKIKGSPLKETSTFSEALDAFFGEQKAAEEEKIMEKKAEEAASKSGRIIEEQKKSLEKWQAAKEDSSENANLIHRNYALAVGILEGLKSARSFGMSWQEIKEKLRASSTPEAGAIKEIKENEGVVVAFLGGAEVLLDLKKSIDENAAAYFEEAKRARRKFENVHAVMERQKETPPVPAPERPAVRARKPKSRWYERFHWFRTSNGFLVVAGKDATQNENLIKKHTDPSDLVFHADLPGSAFIVVKSEGRRIVEPAMKEASEFTAAHCRAWAAGHGEVDIYSVSPEQVSKTAPSGEYLAKGSFMISGRREWYEKVEVKIAIGIAPDQIRGTAVVLSAPLMAVRAQSSYFVTIKPGQTPAAELAQKIKNSILAKARPEDRFWIEPVPLDSFREAVPYGTGTLVERLL